MNRKPAYGSKLHYNQDPTKGVGQLRQQEGGHGSQNPLRRSSGWKSTTRHAASGALPMPLENPEDLMSSTLGRTHNCIRSPNVGQRQAVSAKAYIYRTWPMRIGREILAMAYAHWPGIISNGCGHRLGDIGWGLPTLVVACAHRPGNIGRSLPTSVVACTHKQGDLGYGIRASTNRHSQCQMWPSCIIRGLLTPASRRRTWPTCIINGLQTMINQHWSWPTNIIRGVHTLVIQHWKWPAKINCVLHTSVYRRRTWPTYND
ncbi:hypothetical protein H5410_015203 [Solanum commersonii]|uniref:Uncharacterized protein n=1 Tax=Solanum commersonii TaxID=4109 RepID=A0A9J5ZTF6_SOLCO|nr:hypothetical protein H5410_015203 [Solanum commersonii]